MYIYTCIYIVEVIWWWFQSVWSPMYMYSNWLVHKSHNVHAPYLLCHAEQEYAYFCSKWCIMEYGTCTLWNLVNKSIGSTCSHRDKRCIGSPHIATQCYIPATIVFLVWFAWPHWKQGGRRAWGFWRIQGIPNLACHSVPRLVCCQPTQNPVKPPTAKGMGTSYDDEIAAEYTDNVTVQHCNHLMHFGRQLTYVVTHWRRIYTYVK